MEATTERPIAEITKNANETLRVGISRFNEYDLVNLRVWFKAKDGELRPGKAGVALRIHLVPDLIAALQGVEAEARRRGWRYAIPHFRGCSGELNLAPRAYHSGDWEEVAWLLGRFRTLHRGPIVAVGVSLGGNALLRYAEEAGASAFEQVRALAAISAPLDLDAGATAIGSGFGLQVYTRMFLRSMKPKALRKLGQHPGLFDAERLRRARDLRAFDDVFTAPLHGFRDAADYYARGSAKPRLADIRIPALVLNARNDPFLPGAALPRPGTVGGHVALWQPAHGGHVGFASGAWPGQLGILSERVVGWLSEHR